MVIVEALVDLAELARVVADQIEHPRLLLILDVGERVERRLVSALIARVRASL